MGTHLRECPTRWGRKKTPLTSTPKNPALRKNLERYASVAHFEKLIIEPPARPKGHFRRNGLNQSLAVEMARHGNRGKVQPRLFHRFHRAWKSRNRRGIPTFPQPRRRLVSLTPKGEPRQNRGSRQNLAESAKMSPGLQLHSPLQRKY